jgi:chemosensory pili system protein ChpA (sensor histidine kinase/response regulator)
MHTHSSPPRDSEQATVLIVEDDDVAREAMKALLENDGYRVATAGDGQEAFERLRSGLNPQVIVLDIEMPRMDGFQLRRVLRQEPRLALIPVVVYSGDADLSAVADGCDADAYLHKPFDIDRLRVLLARLCAPRDGY